MREALRQIASSSLNREQLCRCEKNERSQKNKRERERKGGERNRGKHVRGRV